MGSPGQLGPTPRGREQTWGRSSPVLLLSCSVVSPQQRRVPGAWTVPCSAESSARRARGPAGPACPPSRRMTTDAVCRSSSHPVVGAPTLPPLTCLHTCLHTYSAPLQLWDVLCLRAAFQLSSTSSSSSSPLYLCGDGCSAPSHPTRLSWGRWFWAGKPILLCVHPPLVTACGPASTVGSPGPLGTEMGQAAPGDLQGLSGCFRVQALQEQGSSFQHTDLLRFCG